MSFKLLSKIAIATSLAFGIAAQATEFRSGDTHPDGYPTVEAVMFMGKRLEELTKGKHSVKVYPASALGQEKDLIEQTKIVLELDVAEIMPITDRRVVGEVSLEGDHFAFRWHVLEA